VTTDLKWRNENGDTVARCELEARLNFSNFANIFLAEGWIIIAASSITGFKHERFGDSRCGPCGTTADGNQTTGILRLDL
jgi:hypothetical protein